MKLYQWVSVLSLLLILLMLWLGVTKIAKNDFRVAYIDQKGIRLESWSKQRRIKNILTIDKSVGVWIPRGLGWYESDKISRLLQQEDKKELAREILYTNFGYDAGMIFFDGRNEPWWLKYFDFLFVYYYGILTKEDFLNRQLTEAEELLATMMPRDFADSQLVEQSKKISVYNLGDSDGLAGFVARFVEWSGMRVMAVSNLNQNIDFEICKIISANIKAETVTEKTLRRLFPDCQWVEGQSLNDGEIEIFLSDGYARMLNYQSYKNKD